MNSPVGIAGGFDKQGEAIDGLFQLGFDMVEVGTVTPLPQEGNQKPRVFRLQEDEAVINRYGFNSCGLDDLVVRLEKRLWNLKSPLNDKKLLGISIGMNKESKNPFDDYELLARKLCKYADYLAINISSPNTPGLTKLQNEETVRELIERVRKGSMNSNTKIFVKLSPDLNEEDEEGIAKICLQSRVDGIILSNTTVKRDKILTSEHARQSGGLSGKPLFEKSTLQLSRFWTLTGGQIPLIGVGGIFSGQDAYEKISHGASLIQIYTGLIYEGPSIVPKIKSELDDLIKKNGFKNIQEVIGSAHRT